MKRAGFTMIELIFVIVIIGILSAVALPKFLGVASQAHLAKVKSYVGTFNMTTGPAIWSDAISDGNGSISWMGDTNLTDQLPTPKEITLHTTGTGALSQCSLTEPTGAIGTVDTNASSKVDSSTAYFGSAVIGATTYYIGCQDGNASASPRLWVEDSSYKIVAK